MNNNERIWVAKPFKCKLKAEASQKGMSILEFTERLSKQDDPILNMFMPKPKKGANNDFILKI